MGNRLRPGQVVFFPWGSIVTVELRQREQYAKGGAGRWYWDCRDQKALSLIGGEKNILDLGCGEGITLEKMLRQFPGRNILGIDASPEKVKICREHRLPASEGSAYRLNFEDQSWDCCLLLEVIEHLADPRGALREIRRVLRTQGLLILVFPHDWLFKATRLAFLKFKEAFAPSGHVKQWTPREMAEVLKESGFGIKSMDCLPTGLWFCSLHCLVAAQRI